MKRSTKSALLMSALSMLLCVSMLIGTTAAWFTDTVSTVNNIIKAGNLDVNFYYKNDEVADWTEVDKTTNIFKEDTLWEPGHVEVIKLKVANEGTLALQYLLGVSIFEETASINAEGDPFKLSDHIFFGVIEGDTDYTREQAVDAVKNDAKIISTGFSDYCTDDKPLMPKGEGVSEKILTLVVYMPENVGNVANYGKDQAIPTIKLGLDLLATQINEEEDSYGDSYDENASVIVAPGESIADAVSNVEEGGIIYLANGVHTVDSVITVSDREFSIVGLGEVVLQYGTSGGTHFFNIANGSKVTIENITMLNAAKHGVYVRNNATVTMKDVTIAGSKGSADIMIDEASDAGHGKETASYVWLYDCNVDRIAMCASPVTSVAATQDTYVYLNYDADTTVGALEVQSINKKPENIIINGVASTEVGKTMQLYVTNDAELTAALETIKTDENYWNKNVIVYMAAGEYSANHVINQYPKWNGIVGRGNGNNYQGGIPAGEPGTVITFVGETASSYSLRGAQATPTVTFTGDVTVNGFGDAQAGFGTAVAFTTFENIAFENSTQKNVKDTIAAVSMLAAAANVTFKGCTFDKAAFVTVGASGSDRVATITFDGCTFSDVCISGYVDNILTVKNSVVLDAADGFINNQNSGDVVIDNCSINAGRYLVRTNGSGIVITVKNSDITVYESEGTKHLVYFRGSNESAKFIDCNITDGYTIEGADANSTVEIYNYYEQDGITYVNDVLAEETTLYSVPADYTGDTVNVAEGTDSIGNYAFAYNSNVKTVVLPSTVRDLGRGFDSAPSVEKVVLNEGLTTISSRAFKSTTALKEVVIPSTVTEIADNAFQKSGIKEIVIPANVKTVGETAFGGSLIEKVTFEGNTAIQGYAFRGCPNLKEVVLNGANVTFIPSTLSGRNSMWFCNGESGNPNTSDIDFYVKNDVVKERVLVAMGAERDNTDVYVSDTDNEDGTFTDGEGNTYAYAEDNTDFNAGIEKGATTLYLGDGNYIIPDSAQGKTLTISGNGNTVVATQDDGSYEGCDYSLDGATVTFEGINITTDSTTYTGYARLKATYNNCTINGTYTLYDESVFNNCTFNVSGDVYNIWTWGAPTATFNNCTFNTSGKAILLYGGENTVLTVKDCVFNDADDYADVNNKAAIEVGSDWTTDSKTVIADNCTVNGFDVTNKGISTGSTLWGNKNSLSTDRLNVVINGVDVY